MYSGFVGVEHTTTTPSSEWAHPDAQVVVGLNAKVGKENEATGSTTNFSILAPSIKINSGATVHGNLYHASNLANDSGTIEGDIFPNLELPVIDDDPLIASAASNTDDRTISSGNTLALAGGSYGIITVESNATLDLTGGTYGVKKITVDTGGKILFSGIADLVIEEDLVTQDDVAIKSDATAQIPVDQMKIIVMGTDGTSTEAADFGTNNLVTVLVRAPNGTIRLGPDTQGYGVFFATDILVEGNTEATLVTGGDPALADPPTITPNGGTFTGPQVVTLATATTGATIHYTLDGTRPTASSSQYDPVAKITINGSTTLKAISAKSGLKDSPVSTAVFALPVEAVTFSPDPATGPFQEEVEITLATPTPGARIHFTTDGTTPDPEVSRIFTGPFDLIGSATLKAIAVKEGEQDSVDASAAYTVNVTPKVEPVTFSPKYFVFPVSMDVTLATETPGATIHYTLDGTTPTTASPVFTAPITITQTTTLNAIAVKTGHSDSPLRTTTRTLATDIQIEIPIPSISFFSVEFVELKGRPSHEGFFPIEGMPISNISQELIARMIGPVDTANFRLVTPTGVDIQTITLSEPPEADPRDQVYFGSFQPPNQPFQVAASGLHLDGSTYDITFSKVFETKDIGFKNLAKPVFLSEGTTTLFADLTNHGSAGTFTITGVDNQGFISRLEPTSVTLATGQTAQIEFDIQVPAGTPQDTEINFTITATDTLNPSNKNTTEESIWVVGFPKITPPADITTSATGTLTPVILGNATATDNFGIDSIINDAPTEGFPVGTTEVTWTVTDTGGNQSSAVQLVTITSP